MKKYIILTLLCFTTMHTAGAEAPSEMRTSLAAKLGITESEAQSQLTAVFETIADELEAGRPVTIRRFGRFYVKKRDARSARNPRTGEEVQVPARNYPRFSSSEVLKKKLNES